MPTFNIQEKLVLDGKKFTTLREAVNFCSPGADVKKIRHRLKSGWSFKEALDLTARKPHDHRAVVVGGLKYKNLSAAVEAFCPHLTIDIVRDRIRKMDWTLEEALMLDHKVRAHSNKVTIDGVTFSSQNEAAKSLNINKHTYRNRIARGYSPKKAGEIDFVRSNKFQSKLLPFISSGILFDCIESYLQENYPLVLVDELLVRKIKRYFNHQRKKLSLTEVSIYDFSENIGVVLPKHECERDAFWVDAVKKAWDLSLYFPDLSDLIVSIEQRYELEANYG